MKIKDVVTLSLLMIFVSACSQTREQFDFTKKPPDEFAVVKRAPLELPPDYTLRPPRPGVQRPQEATTDNAAAQAVFGESIERNLPADASSGEALLLQKTGADKTSSEIRDIVDIETTNIAKENTSTFNKLIGRTGTKENAPVSVVDPKKESERILDNQKTGKSVMEGETPTIEE